MTTAVRTALLALLALVLLGGCARPGQLGHEDEAPADPAPEAAPAPPPAAPGDSAADSSGRLPGRIEIRTLGEADVLVRTETLEPGRSSGWISHPGTVISVVRSGTVTVTQRPDCAASPFGPGQAFFVADAAAYEMRNDGPDPVVLTRSEVLAPDTDERRPADPVC